MGPSVVVPAFNEGAVIGRCLDGLVGQRAVKVIVAANGCTDDTASQARARGVVVAEVAQASKVAALNAGDALAGDAFPRVYLDADIELGPGAVDALVSELTSRVRPAVAMPRLVFDVTRSSLFVRAFFQVYTRLPYISEGLVGAGCYAVNRAGRQRWGQFPDLVADDLFVQGQFTPDERLTVEATCIARPPRTTAALLKVRTRTYHGNRQAVAFGLAGEMTDTRGRSLAALRRLLLRRPWLFPHAIVYIAVNVIAQRRASRLTDDAPWLTDSSSRS